MRWSFPGAFLVVVSFFLTSSTAVAIKDGEASADDRVIVMYTAFPWNDAPMPDQNFPMTANREICSAVRLCPTVYITAIHCYPSHFPHLYYGTGRLYGQYAWSTPDVTEYYWARQISGTIRETRRHDVFEERNGWDGIRVFRVNFPFPGTSAKLVAPDYYPGDEEMTAVGWGRNFVVGGDLPFRGSGSLRQGRIEFLYQETYDGDKGPTATFGPGSTGQFTLPGDSGGGIFTDTGELFGIIVGPGRGGNPDTDPITTAVPIAPYRAFIDQAMADWCPAAPPPPPQPTPTASATPTGEPEPSPTFVEPTPTFVPQPSPTFVEPTPTYEPQPSPTYEPTPIETYGPPPPPGP